MCPLLAGQVSATVPPHLANPRTEIDNIFAIVVEMLAIRIGRRFAKVCFVEYTFCVFRNSRSAAFGLVDCPSEIYACNIAEKRMITAALYDWKATIRRFEELPLEIRQCKARRGYGEDVSLHDVRDGFIELMIFLVKEWEAIESDSLISDAAFAKPVRNGFRDHQCDLRIRP